MEYQFTAAELAALDSDNWGLATPLVEIDLPLSALAEIEANQSNRIRCALTGAPVSTVDSKEILAYLRGQSRQHTTVDGLIDSWDLVMFALSSKPGPALMNQKEMTLSALADGSQAGFARLITFLLTKLAYGQTRQTKQSLSTRGVNRMHFAAEWFDLLADESHEDLQDVAYMLTTCDSWMDMAHWGTLLTRFNRNSKNLNWLASITAFPDQMPLSIDSLSALGLDMIRTMAESAADGMSEAPVGLGSRLLADELATALQLTRPDAIDVVRDTLSAVQAEMEMLERDQAAARTRRQPHSVIHGRGVTPGSSPAPKAAKATTTPKAPKGPKAPPSNESAKAKEKRQARERMNQIMAAAMNQIGSIE